MITESIRTEWLVLKIMKGEGESLVLPVEKTESSKTWVHNDGCKDFKHELRLVCYGRSGQVITVFGGSFSGASCHEKESVFHLADGNMYLDSQYRGLGIGTSLQQQVVLWAKALNRKGRIRQIMLAKGDAGDVESRDRRNRFYEQFGFRFNWSPTEKGEIERAAGYSQESLTIDDIQPLSTLKRAQFIPFTNYLWEAEYALEALTADAAVAKKQTALSLNDYLKSRSVIRRYHFVFLIVLVSLFVVAYFLA